MKSPNGNDLVGSFISTVRDHEQLLYEHNVLLSFNFCKTLESSCEIPCLMRTASTPDRLDERGMSRHELRSTCARAFCLHRSGPDTRDTLKREWDLEAFFHCMSWLCLHLKGPNNTRRDLTVNGNWRIRDWWQTAHPLRLRQCYVWDPDLFDYVMDRVLPYFHLLVPQLKMWLLKLAEGPVLHEDVCAMLERCLEGDTEQ
ncbi:hypothetical protein NEOLEDRAFT_1134302 [Neolentinus lepideus HHB14362 ss-1]|uniref:Fungal-type protein kinase domain-containing protein n=1 Tax=Neolentinus lepideus HHB14362 ss-1 TaxID=1314782 RepID=A0A165SF89_9AGAM|nr:hypothetical protein NEOLEDRAFT_1134302 [Neolentinus lepideus HHB14362 ss-1]